MVQIIQGSELDFRAAVYGMPHPGSLALVKQTTEALSQAFGGMQNAFIEKVKQVSHDFTSNQTLNLMKAALNKITHAFLPDIIQYYDNIDTIQQAAPKMRYLIMSEPELLDRYRSGQISGYGKHFEDLYPEMSGFNHPVYQAVNNGLVVEGKSEEEEDRIEMWATSPDDLELSISEQVDIKRTQMLTLNYVLYGKNDPTDEWNQRL